MDKNLPVLCADDVCTGCSACMNACGQRAIYVEANEEGFYRPVVIDSKCIGCMKCERSCPILHPLLAEISQGVVYAAWNKDEEIRRQSASGGAFTALAERVIEKGGVVVGAAYSSPAEVRHICVDDKENLKKLRSSKFVQSRVGFVYRAVEQYLMSQREVLFTGTPCQVAGLMAYLKHEYDNLICVDFICHGVPSPLLAEKYVEWLERKYGDIDYIDFRDKRKGWFDALRVVHLKNGKNRVMRGKSDNYWIAFNKSNCLQLCCYDCRYRGQQRLADITIADFWGIGKSISFAHKDEVEKGISMVMCNSEKGQNYLDCCKDKLILFERDIREVFSGNQTIIHSVKMPGDRATFYADLNRLFYMQMIRRYLLPDFKTRLVKFMREYFPLRLVRFIRMSNQE